MDPRVGMNSVMQNMVNALLPGMQHSGVNPLINQQSMQIRPSFLEMGGDAVAKSREDEILNELLFNSFDYVPPNGYLGQRNKIYRDNLRNSALHYKAPLWYGREWEPNHGLHPLRGILQPVKMKAEVTSHKKHLLAKSAGRRDVRSHKVKVGETLPGDLNTQASVLGLPYRKPTPFHFTRNTNFDLTPAKDPAGVGLPTTMRKAKCDTWNYPFHPSKRPKHGRVSSGWKAKFKSHFDGIANY